MFTEIHQQDIQCSNKCSTWNIYTLLQYCQICMLNFFVFTAKLFHVEHIAHQVTIKKTIVPRGTLLFFVSFYLLTGCIHQTKEEKTMNHILASFISKTPNQLYEVLGKPDSYDVVTNNHNRIKYATIKYNYVYNFLTQEYECNIIFKTDKEQDEIVDAQYLSPYCLYITSF